MVFANAFHFMFTGLQGYPIGVPATGAYAFEPSLLCGAIFFFFLCNGPGKLVVSGECFFGMRAISPLDNSCFILLFLAWPSAFALANALQ